MNMEEKSTKSPPKCVMFHHKNPFLKLGPFHTEIISFQPYRAMFHNVSKYIYKYITIHTYLHWRRSALNSAGAFPENFGEFSPIQHFIL